MKYLTDISSDGYIIPQSDSTSLQEIMETLWEYEHTGLTPGEVKSLMIEAKREKYCPHCGGRIQ